MSSLQEVRRQRALEAAERRQTASQQRGIGRPSHLEQQQSKIDRLESQHRAADEQNNRTETNHSGLEAHARNLEARQRRLEKYEREAITSGRASTENKLTVSLYRRTSG